MIDPGKDLDISSEYDLLTEADRDYPDTLLSTIYEEEKLSDNRDSYEETKSSHTSFMQSPEQSDRVHVPTAEEIKNDTGGKQLQIKMQYVDAISRVFYHLRGALEEHNFLNEQMSQRLQLARVIPDPNSLDSGNENATIINLEELFKSVLEDDRHQPD